MTAHDRAVMDRPTAWLCGLFSFHRFCINFNPGDVGPSTLAVSASRHEVRESDFIDSAQIRRVDPIANGHDPLRIQFSPPYFAHRHVALKPIDRRAFELVADGTMLIGDKFEGSPV